MGGGNGQKSKMARERNIEKQKAAKRSQLESNKKAMTIQVVSLQAFVFKFCYHIYAISFPVCFSFSFFYGIISCWYIFSELYNLIAI